MMSSRKRMVKRHPKGVYGRALLDITEESSLLR